MGEFRHIPTDGGTIHCYVAVPERPTGCGIVLASSVWGLNSDLRSVADGYLALGYAVIAPNMLSRITPEHGVEYDFSRFDDVVKYADSGSDAEGLVDLRTCRAELANFGCSRVAAVR